MTLRELLRSARRGALAPAERASRPFRGWWPRLSDALIGMFALVVVGLALATYSPALSRNASELLAGNRYLALIDGLFNPFRTQHLLLNSGLPVYDLSIKKQQYALLEEAVAKARKQGFMDDSLKVWADAKFLHDGEEYNVKVRIRGDLPPHWQGPKKSWRIKFGNITVERDGERVKEPYYFDGKRQINLIIPIDRDYVLSYFVNSLMNEQGLVVPRDRFVVLRINGAMQGLYYEVEHFDKPLLASRGRPETAVFAQNDRAMHFEKYSKYGTPGASDARFDLGSIRQLVDREGDLGLRAIRVLIDHSLDPTPEAFRRVRAVLDWERYLRFRNLTTLCNTNHVRFGSDNLRLYYDESRGLLEPVPWDLHITRMPSEPGTIDFWNSHGPDAIQRATLTDPELRLERNRLLWELLADGGRSLMKRYDRIHDKIRPLAWADVLRTPIQGHKMDQRRADLAYNVRRVHKVLSSSTGSLVYRLETSDRAALELAATSFSGLQLEQIELSDPAVFEGAYRLYEDTNDDGRLDEGDALLAETTSAGGRIAFEFERPLLPEVEYGGDFIKNRYWEYFETRAGRVRFFLAGRVAPERRHPLQWTSPAIEVAAVNAVTGLRMASAELSQTEPLPENHISIASYDGSDPFDLDAPERTLGEFVSAHPQFRPSSDRPGAAELSGAAAVSGTVIVPKTVPLILKPGTELAMSPGASILAYGGLIASGTPEAPIRIHEAEPGEAWGVLAVVRPPEPVVASHLQVRGAGQAQLNGILFTGGFAVHDGDLEIEHCRFSEMQSEDGVNLKNGRISMSNCVIADGASDGMDLDFVTGEVRDSAFLGNRGDGLDISGSQVLVVGNRFERMGDKGISVGENSQPIIVNNLLRANTIGISTKDLSFARVAYSTFVDNTLAIEAKRKKPFFGGGGGEFLNNVFTGNEELLTQDSFSAGKVVLGSSLVDVAAASCSDCETGPARFISLERGDYRLAPAGVDGDGFQAAQIAWSGIGERFALPAQPGIFPTGGSANGD
jgi:hypothetical protein